VEDADVQGADGHDAERPSGHVIVCGLDGLALLTIEQLVAVGSSVVVVDRAPLGRHVDQLAAWQVSVVRGDPRDPAALGRAAIDRASAVLCVQSDDIDSLGTALLAHELAPSVRLAARIDNPAVGQALAEVTGPGTVFDTAGLAAPSIVEACRRRLEHEIEIDGHRFVLAEVIAPQTESLRGLFGHLAPIAVAPSDGGPLLICPGRDQLVTAGDRVTVLGSPDDVDYVRPAVAVAERRARRLSGARARLRTLRGDLQRLLGEVDVALRTALIAVASLMVVSTVVLRFGYRPAHGGHISLLDALYFTVSTDATVGYGDYNFSGQSAGLKAFGIVDIVVGVVLATAVFAMLTNFLVSRRLAQALGRRRVTGMTGHVVLIGLGAVGMRVLETLRAFRDVVVIEADDGRRFVSQARALGVPVVIGDATLPQTLDLVNLAEASAVAVLTSSDLTNVEIGLALRDRFAAARRGHPIVLRVFDRQLARSAEQSFGFAHVRSTSALAAPWFVGAALGLEVLDTFYVGRQPFLLARLAVGAGGGLDGTLMKELSARTRVVALDRVGSGLEYPPRRDTAFQAGDAAYLVGPYEELLQVLLSERSAGVNSPL
jgi:Trk K+ transport system NAD-binding subunit